MEARTTRGAGVQLYTHMQELDQPLKGTARALKLSETQRKKPGMI